MSVGKPVCELQQ